MEKYKGTEITFSKSYEHYFDLTCHEKNGVRKFYGYKARDNDIEKEMQLCGYFVIVTSKKMSAKVAL